MNQPTVTHTEMVRMKPTRLAVAAHVSVIVACAVYLGGPALDFAAGIVDRVRNGAPKLDQYGSAYAQEMRFTFTNRDSVAMRACVKGVLTSLATKEKAESVVVCTGPVAPYSTVSLTAPYRAGSGESLCSVSTGEHQGRRLDWGSCAFEVVDATPK